MKICSFLKREQSRGFLSNTSTSNNPRRQDVPHRLLAPLRAHPRHDHTPGHYQENNPLKALKRIYIFFLQIIFIVLFAVFVTYNPDNVAYDGTATNEDAREMMKDYPRE